MDKLRSLNPAIFNAVLKATGDDHDPVSGPHLIELTSNFLKKFIFYYFIIYLYFFKDYHKKIGQHAQAS